MDEITIRFLDLAKIKFIGNSELMETVKAYYPGLESDDNNVDYILKSSKTILSENIEIASGVDFIKSFAGPKYYSWQDGEYTLAYSPREEWEGGHFVIKKGKNFQVSFHNGESSKAMIGISREILTKEVLNRKYMPIHASAISDNGRGHIFFGDKNRGKSTSFFSNILYKNAKPMSGDIAFVTKEDDGWKVLGWPWTATIAQSYFDITGIKYSYNTSNKGKIKFLPANLCKEFDTEWIWKQPLDTLTNVNLEPNKNPRLETISPQELEQRLKEYGKEEWWQWNDVFKLGEKAPVYEYGDISKEVKGRILSGDIIQMYKEKEELEL